MATAFHRRRMTGEQHLTSGQEGSAPCLAARSARPTGAELVELDRGTSLRLLATSAIGRVIFTDGALPAAQPVTYLLDHEEIIFRTANGSKLAAATRNAIVAFEVDEIDSVNRSGWSVLGVGHAYEVTDPQRLADLADSTPRPWVPGPLPHTTAVPLQRLTGRQLSEPDRRRAAGWPP
jgi:hypothetical protein